MSVRRPDTFHLQLGRPAQIAAVMTVALTACEAPDPELIPDAVLQSELGLTEDDRVHTIRIRTGTTERAEPDSLSVRPRDFVQFVTVDRLVHEVAFVLDSLNAVSRAFLERTGQAASPPLIELDARFVVSFADAPLGRYPYHLRGNRGSGSGVIVVEAEAR